MLEYQCPPSLAVFLDGAAAIVDSYTRARRSRGISIKKVIFSSRSNSRRKRERKKGKYPDRRNALVENASYEAKLCEWNLFINGAVLE